MTLAELEMLSEAARQRFRQGRVHLSEATRPPQLLRTGYALASKAAHKLMPEASRQMSEHTGAAIANMLVGASATFIATQIARLGRSTATASQAAAPVQRATPDYSAAEDRHEVRTARRPTTAGAQSLIKSAAMAGAAWYAGSLLSRKVKPTMLERQMAERYGTRFADWLATARRDGPSYIMRASGLGDKASTVLIMLSAAAALIKSVEPRTASQTAPRQSS